MKPRQLASGASVASKHIFFEFFCRRMREKNANLLFSRKNFFRVDGRALLSGNFSRLKQNFFRVGDGVLPGLTLGTPHCRMSDVLIFRQCRLEISHSAYLSIRIVFFSNFSPDACVPCACEKRRGPTRHRKRFAICGFDF
jgi:hypothetical protein